MNEGPKRSIAAVAGIGTTTYGVHPGQSSYSLGAAALHGALIDAGLQHADVDSLIVCRIPDYQRFGEMLGVNPCSVVGLPGQGRMSAVALSLAVAQIGSGQARTVALVYGNDGKSAGVKYGGVKDTYGSGGAAQWFPFGMTSPGAAHAMMFTMHAARYGTRAEDLGAVAKTFRDHASLNPAAVMRQPFSMDEYLATRYIAEPLRLLDYCLINDGGIALILTTASRACELAQRPVYVRGMSTQTMLAGSSFPQSDFWFPALRAAAERSFAAAELKRDDVDGLMIYDNFTPTVLFSLEGFGYCEPGNSGSFVRCGNLALGGRYPTNTHGGHLSEGYMQGWNHFLEAVRQLRGSCGDRQIAGARHIHYMCGSPIASSILFSNLP